MTSSEVLFKFVRLALGRESDFTLPSDLNWKQLIELSFSQGVSALTIDGYQSICDCPENSACEKDSGTVKALEALDALELEEDKYLWFSSLLDSEQVYLEQKAAIDRLSSFYRKRSIDMLLLKGYGLSLNYPIPSHRGVGDIDIYLFGDWKKADEVMERERGVKVDNSHHHHSVFSVYGQSVENHYDFINVYSHRSNKGIEATFKSLAHKENQIPYESFFLPCPDLNALFVARHCAIHFASEGIKLRQLLDWGLFVEKNESKINWEFFWSESEKMGMLKFVLCINQILAEQLNFNASIFHTPQQYASFAQENETLVKKILEDLTLVDTDQKKRKGVIAYVFKRFGLWWRNRWRHRIVYSDSLLSTFFAQIGSHLMKPATIKGK